MAMASRSEGGGGGGEERRRGMVKVAGAWSGTLEAPLDEWTVADLRGELSQRSGFPANSINLISAGKTLRDDGSASSGGRSLRSLGLKDNCKLLMTRIGAEQAAPVIVAKERADRLARIKSAADAMAKRSNEDSYPTDDFDLQLENQSGERLTFASDEDRRALVMGLMLHAKARKFIQQKQYLEALEILNMAEESFSLCDNKFLEAIDNVALLQIDTVWCLFMLRDITRLAVARERLARARDGLCLSHGRNLERLRVLQGGFCPELAIYVRLELLEGVVSYHSGLQQIAQQSLISAQKKYQQLQVSDEALVLLAGMGFTTKESIRGLRVSGQDIERAVEFVMEQRKKLSEKEEEDRQRRKERREQKKYGKTQSGKAVDLKKLGELVSIGCDKQLAAEALRQSSNDGEKALDILVNPALRAALEVSLESKKRRRKSVDQIALAELVSMGFEQGKAVRALQTSSDTDQAMEKLLGDNHNLDETEKPDVDEEMEQEIAVDLTGDPLEGYDIEVDEERDAIIEYLTLIDST
ncbi:hypothetical protein O6H91_10G067200 [Diphasiastrum complanatum]|uniref:Uncharacterized protein n=1 Tax=Diphasiastrum complanatum TaxID=34168 RepID=A0ACC2CHX0_DIPCM|nr:hypothetical protein O6H91_10G067200 [Diphasiastrum complanatum]